MDTIITLIYIACGIGGYLIGSISPALIISNSIAKKDIRKYGSGNAGTTNMMRTFGWKLGVLTFLLDVIKGIVVVVLARHFGGSVGGMIATLCVIAGNNWPIYYGFKGGKGIAATVGVLFVWQPAVTGVLLAVLIGLIIITRIVSISSLIGTVLSAIATFVFYPGEIYHQIAICALCLFSIYGHRENIARLIKGKENKLNFSKKAPLEPERSKK